MPQRTPRADKLLTGRVAQSLGADRGIGDFLGSLGSVRPPSLWGRWRPAARRAGDASARWRSPPSPRQADGPDAGRRQRQPRRHGLSIVGTGWLGRTLGLKRRMGHQAGRPVARGYQHRRRGRRAARRVDQQPGAVRRPRHRCREARRLAGRIVRLPVPAVQRRGHQRQAGSIAGYNGIVGLPPFNRTEILEAWYLQEMMKDVLKMRIGRSLPTYDFGNVLRPVALADTRPEHPGRERPAVVAHLRQRVDDRRSWATTTRPTA